MQIFCLIGGGHIGLQVGDRLGDRLRFAFEGGRRDGACAPRDAQRCERGAEHREHAQSVSSHIGRREYATDQGRAHATAAARSAKCLLSIVC